MSKVPFTVVAQASGITPAAPNFKVPPFTLAVPVKVFAPDMVQVPVPNLFKDVVPEPSGITPDINPVPAVDPCKVKVLAPAPVAW